jgi:hypothetical protein
MGPRKRHFLIRAGCLLIAAFLALARVTLASAGSGVSGGYLAKFTDGSIFLQLVEADPGHLTGR